MTTVVQLFLLKKNENNKVESTPTTLFFLIEGESDIFGTE